MAVIACPTAVVRAPAAAIWRVLMNLEGYDRWADARLVTATPPGPPVEGQRIDFTTRGLGRTWPVRFTVAGVHEPVSLELLIELPLGIVNREHIVLAPLSPTETRVTFN
jgi:hypothetical protein